MMGEDPPLDPEKTPTLDPDDEVPNGAGPGAEPRTRPEGETKPSRRLEILGPYRILEEIGRGGMGVVYKAYYPQLKRNVALKVLIAGEDASEDAIARFHREAEAVAKLGHHPNIVPVYDIGTEGNLHYFAMHFVEGKGLDALIDEGEITPVQAATIAKKLAEALHHAHQHGVLHRDVKPSNVLMAFPRLAGESPDEPKDEIPNLNGKEKGGTPGVGGWDLDVGGSAREGGEPMLTDFGLAKDVESDSKMTRTGMTLGTPQYMPPEQADGRLKEVDARSDVYSLGATLYEMLTSTPPFTGTGVVNILCDILLNEPVPPRRRNPDVDRDLEVICLKCMEKKPADRYPTAKALADDLGRTLNRESILARPPSPLQRLKRWSQRQRTALLAASSTLLLAGVVGLILFLVLQNRGPAPLDVETKRTATQMLDRGRSYLEQAKRAQIMDDPKICRALLDRALQAFTKACEADPKNAEAFAEKGKVLTLLKRPEKALTALQRALALNPDLSGPYHLRIQIQYIKFILRSLLTGAEASKQTRKKIEADLSRLEAIGTQPWVVHWGRALLLAVDGHREDALAEIDLALEANPTFPDGFAARGQFRTTLALIDPQADKREILTGALEDFSKALRLAGENTDYRISRIQVLLYLDRAGDAEKEADAMVTALHDNPYPYLLRGQIRLARGNRAGFNADMDKADNLPFANPDLHLIAAGVILGGFQSWRFDAIKTDEVGRALKHVNLLIERHPEQTEAYGIRGLLRMLEGQGKPAIGDFQKYLEKHGDSQMAPTFRGAVTALELGMDLSCESPLLVYYAATQRAATGAWQEAENLYKQALEGIEKLPPPSAFQVAIAHQEVKKFGRMEIARLISRRAGLPEADPDQVSALLREAMESLDTAVREGYSDFSNIDTNPDFAPLRATEKFKAWRKAWKEKGK
ncbi:MAG: protein kinase domain-containing protein [Planctomycetota bacterium]|jgi:serine/threonine protein kinase